MFIFVLDEKKYLSNTSHMNILKSIENDFKFEVTKISDFFISELIIYHLYFS